MRHTDIDGHGQPSGPHSLLLINRFQFTPNYHLLKVPMEMMELLVYLKVRGKKLKSEKLGGVTACQWT